MRGCSIERNTEGLRLEIDIICSPFCWSDGVEMFFGKEGATEQGSVFQIV